MRVPGKKDLIQLGDHKNLSLSSHPFFPLTFEIPPLYSHHHFRGIKLLERETLGVSNIPRANDLLLDKNEPMICDNSLDLLLENGLKGSSLCAESTVLGITYFPVPCNYKLLCLWLSIHRFFEQNLNMPKRWWRCRSERVKNSQGIYPNTFTFNSTNCETSTRFRVYHCMQIL